MVMDMLIMTDIVAPKIAHLHTHTHILDNQDYHTCLYQLPHDNDSNAPKKGNHNEKILINRSIPKENCV